MDYICQHCGANLDEGDVFEHYLQVYSGDKIKALQSARMHGWSETDSLIVSQQVEYLFNRGKIKGIRLAKKATSFIGNWIFRKFL